MTTRLEPELREQPEALARLLDRQTANAAELGALFHRDDVKLPPDRLARQLVQRGALRAVPARPREPRAGRVRDAVALHALRAAAAARRRARDRHLAVGRVAGRPRRDRRGAPPGPADDRDHEPARLADRRARPRRCCRSRRATSSRSRRRRRTSTRSARSRCSSPRRRATTGRCASCSRCRRGSPASSSLSFEDAAGARRPRRRPRRHGRRARHQLRHVVRDRAEDPRALRPALRGLVGRRPDARPGRRDRAGLAGARDRPERAGAREHEGRDREPRRARRAASSRSPTARTCAPPAPRRCGSYRACPSGSAR